MSRRSVVWAKFFFAVTITSCAALTVTALAIASGNYTSVFGTGLNIRGYIPFYPAIHGSEFIDGGISAPEFYEPATLVTRYSPPCLVYQGTQDGLVRPQASQDLKDAYDSAGNHEKPARLQEVSLLPC
jgi:hypothetical protein